ncbi:MAG: hypothetical protein JO356_14765 [Acidobacteria bacterium]|nr:hypothetical protein [Acidobacteriota bacterium]
MSNLLPEHNIFMVGTTNHLENIDTRVLRGGRFSEKIAIGLPRLKNREILLRRYLRGLTSSRASASIGLRCSWMAELRRTWRLSALARSAWPLVEMEKPMGFRH